MRTVLLALAIAAVIVVGQYAVARMVASWRRAVRIQLVRPHAGRLVVVGRGRLEYAIVDANGQEVEGGFRTEAAAEEVRDLLELARAETAR